MASLAGLLAYGVVCVVFNETSASALVSAGDSYPSRSPTIAGKCRLSGDGVTGSSP